MPRLGTAFLSAVLIALTVAAYLPIWNNGFVDIDDDWYITANPEVQQGFTLESFKWAWTTFHGKYWQPLSWLALQFDAQFFSTTSASGERLLSPAAFHVDSLCWHLASMVLLFAAWQRLTGERAQSFLVAALFALHPMRVESVAWAAERKDVLSVFFGVLTLWAYAGYAQKPDRARYIGVAAAYTLSLLSKPMLMTLPLVLLLLDYWPLRRWSYATTAPHVSWWRMLLEKVPLFGLAAGIAIVTVVARDQTNAAVPLSELPMSDRLANAAIAYGAYLANTFYPVRLAVLYPHPMDKWSPISALVGGGLLFGVTLLALRRARQWPWLIVGWSWFVIGLLPVIGLAQGGPQAWADRFCYWPHIGLFVAFSWSVCKLAEQSSIPTLVSRAVAVAALGVLAALTWIQVGYWRDPYTLWQRALAVTARNAEAHKHMGEYYLHAGQLDKAESHLTEAWRIDPRSFDDRRTLATSLLRPERAPEMEPQ